MNATVPRQPVASSGVPGRTVYFPAITKARVAKQYALGPYRAALLTDCGSVGSVSYSYVIYVRRQGESAPLLAMASEIADDVRNKGQRCLAMFYQGRHYNFGFSSDWLDQEKFSQEGLAIAMEQLSVSDSPQELPERTDTGFSLSFLK